MAPNTCLHYRIWQRAAWARKWVSSIFQLESRATRMGPKTFSPVLVISGDGWLKSVVGVVREGAPQDRGAWASSPGTGSNAASTGRRQWGDGHIPGSSRAQSWCQNRVSAISDPGPSRASPLEGGPPGKECLAAGAGWDLHLSNMSSRGFLGYFFLKVVCAGTRPHQLLLPVCVTPQFSIPCVKWLSLLFLS